MRTTALIACCLAVVLLAAEVNAARPPWAGNGGKGKGKEKNSCGAIPGGEPGSCAACAGNSKKCQKCNQAPGGRGYYPKAKSGCIGCKDVNCANCNNGGSCKTCVDGYALQGNKCMMCTGENMVIKKGRCSCADGFEWNAGKVKTSCVPATPDDA